jgi:hypothetical protein
MWGFGKSVVLLSTFDAETCKARLNAELASPWDFFSKRAFIGRAGDRRVSVRKNINYRNSWQTVFVGSLKPTSQGTRLIGRFRLNLFVIAFMAVWFGFVGLACFAFVGEAFSGDIDAWIAVTPIGMVVFGLVLVKGGQYLARNERDEILRFFEGVVDARQVA